MDYTAHEITPAQMVFCNPEMRCSDVAITAGCARFIAHESRSTVGTNAALTHLCKPEFSR